MEDKFETKYPEIPHLGENIMDWAMNELKRLRSVGE